MAFAVKDLTRLNATVHVSRMELEHYRGGSAFLMRDAAQMLAERCVRKILDDCIHEETGDPDEGDSLHDRVLRLDCYVLSPLDLDKLISAARASGSQDASYWLRQPLWQAQQRRQEEP